MAKKEYDFRGKLFHVDPAWQKTLKRLDDMERLRIWDAIMSYRTDGEEVSLTGKISERAEGVYWSILDTLARLDSNAKEYKENLSTTRSEIGKRGAEARWRDEEEEGEEDMANDGKNSKNSKNSKDDKNGIPLHSTPNHSTPDVIKRDRQAISLSQETGDDTAKTIRKQKLLDNEEVKEVANYYNAQIKETGANFAQCINVEGQRASLISARIKQYGKENVKLAINKIFASKWIAENTKTSVRNITWIMKPENCRKILEGNYDNDKQPAPSTSQPKRHYDDNTSDDFKITEYWNKYNETH